MARGLPRPGKKSLRRACVAEREAVVRQAQGDCVVLPPQAAVVQQALEG